MNLMWWRKKGTNRIQAAREALAVSDRELVEAEKLHAVSESRRISLAEIRRNNHFTQSIFPKGT